MVSSINNGTAVSSVMKNEGCVSLRAVQSDILHVQGPHWLSFSPGRFPLCILFIHASCNSVTILHSQCLLSLPSDYNTIHLQGVAIGFSFYMQSISMSWPLTLKLRSRRLQMHMPSCATYRKEKQRTPAMWPPTVKHRNRCFNLNT